MKLYTYSIRRKCIAEIKEPQVVTNSEIAANSARKIIDMECGQEQMAVLFLNTANMVAGGKVVSIGTLDRSISHPRDIFRLAILKNSKAIILAHNHPSGNLTPSYEDNKFTKKITAAGELLGIAVLDHIIITDCDYYSYLDNNQL